MDSENKDPYTYQKEQERFLKDLRQYHAHRGTPVVNLPTVGGRHLDLYLLYNKVIGLGGWQKVNNEQRWDELQEDFHIPRFCTNAAQALRDIYIRYLAHYERVHHFGDDPDQELSMGTETSSLHNNHKKKSIFISNIPQFYNHKQHNVSNFVRESAGLSTSFVDVGEYKRLEKSLLSGLPNEVDFAINVCLLMSAAGHRTIQLRHGHHLLELLMGQVGVFRDGPGAFYHTYEYGWKPQMGQRYLQFWTDTVQDTQVRDLVLPQTLSRKKDAKTVSIEVEEKYEMGLLNIQREIGVYDREYQRVVQLVSIIRNFSFEQCNMEPLATNLLVFRFLLLCIYNRYPVLRQLGLDALANITEQMVLDPIEYRTSQLMLQTVTRCVASSDKLEVVRGMEVLAKLCQVEDNDDVISENLEDRVYEAIVNMLLVHDMQIIVHALEVLYLLSELGEAASTHIAEVKSCVERLVNLTTIEAQSYGPSSLVGIKVVEHIPPSQVNLQQLQQVAPPTQSSLPKPQRPLVPTTVTAAAARPQHMPTPPPDKRPSRVSTPSSRAGTPLPQRPPTPAPTPPQADGEALACSWLHAHFEAQKGGSVGKMEVFAEYLGGCRKYSIKQVINSDSFYELLRVAFPGVESKRIEKPNGSVDVVFRGMSKRTAPLPFQAPSQDNFILATPLPGTPPPASLQQHRSIPTPPGTPQMGRPTQPNPCTPPPCPAPQSYPTIQKALLGQTPETVAKSSNSKNKTGGVSSQSKQPQTPHLPKHHPQSQFNRTGRPADSNLIKSLLANKVAGKLKGQTGSPPGTPDSVTMVPKGTTLVGEPQVAQLPSDAPVQAALQPATAFPLPPIQTTTASLTPVSDTQPQYTDVRGMPNPGGGGCGPPVEEVAPPSNPPPTSQGITNLTVPTSGFTYQANSVSKTPSKSTKKKSTSPARSLSPKGKSLQAKSPVQRAASPKGNKSPRAHSPKGYLMEVCQQVERAEEVVQKEQQAHEARIERVQNTMPGYKMAEAQLERLHANDNLNVEAFIEKVENTCLTGPQAVLVQETVGDSALPDSSISDNGEHEPVIPTVVEEKAEISTKSASQLCGDIRSSKGISEHSTLTSDIHDINSVDAANIKINGSQSDQDSNGPAQILPDGNHMSSGISVLDSDPMLTDGMDQSSVSSDRQQVSSLVNGSVSEESRDACEASEGATNIGDIADEIIPSPLADDEGKIQDIQKLKHKMAVNGLVNHIGNGDYLSGLSDLKDQADSDKKDLIKGLSHISDSDLSNNIDVYHAKDATALMPNGLSSPTHHVKQDELQTTESDISKTDIIDSKCLSVDETMADSTLSIVDNHAGVNDSVSSNLLLDSDSGALLNEGEGDEGVSNLESQDILLAAMMSSGCCDPDTCCGDGLGCGEDGLGDADTSLEAESETLTISVEGPNLADTSVTEMDSQMEGDCSTDQVLSSESLDDLPDSTDILAAASQSVFGTDPPVNIDEPSLPIIGQPAVALPISVTQPLTHLCTVTTASVTIPQIAPVSISSRPTLVPAQTLVPRPGGSLQQQVILAPAQPTVVGTGSQPAVMAGHTLVLAQQNIVAQPPVALAVRFVAQQPGSGAQVVGTSQPAIVSVAGSVPGQMPVILAGSSAQPTIMSVAQPSAQKTMLPQQTIMSVGGVMVQGKSSTVPVMANLLQQQTVVRTHMQATNLPQPLMTAGLPPNAKVPLPPKGTHLATGAATVALAKHSVLPTAPVSVTATKIGSGGLKFLQGSTSLDRPVASPPPIIQVPQCPMVSLPLTSPSDTASSSNPSPSITPAPSPNLKRPAPTDSKKSNKKRKSSREAESRKKGTQAASRQPKAPLSHTMFMCEWANCKKCFETAAKVQSHVFKTHFNKTAPFLVCLWDNCDGVQRKRWSFIQHMSDRHVAEHLLRAAMLRRQQVSQSGGTTPATTDTPAVPPPGYPPDAALQAIRRFTVRPPFPDFLDPKEGPVTKHIRLTSALILRNLARYSAHGRSLIKRHEEHLAYVSMSNVEASNALASCLWELHQPHSPTQQSH